jgi:hypothetical protein
MKLVLGMNTHRENPLNALQRRLEFKVSGFKFQVCSFFEKELQCMNVNFRQVQGLFPESASIWAGFIYNL